jgi:DNA-binding transcriptional ArsR family regulator
MKSERLERRAEKKRLDGMLKQLKNDADAFFSDMAPINRPCATCHGSGFTIVHHKPCRTCKGTGVKPLAARTKKNIELVIDALRRLTPPQCPEATTSEIHRAIRDASDLTISGVGRVLVYLQRDGLVAKRRMGPEVLWSIRSMPSEPFASTKKSGGK